MRTTPRPQTAHDAFGLIGTTLFSRARLESASIFRESGPDKSERNHGTGGRTERVAPASSLQRRSWRCMSRVCRRHQSLTPATSSPSRRGWRPRKPDQNLKRAGRNPPLVVYQVPNFKAPHHYANMVCLWRAAAKPKKIHLGRFRSARLISALKVQLQSLCESTSGQHPVNA
jgi:hypothetical protein